MNCDRFHVRELEVKRCQRQRESECDFRWKRKTWDLDLYFGSCWFRDRCLRIVRCDSTRHPMCDEF
jgi:hypothetical protein